MSNNPKAEALSLIGKASRVLQKGRPDDAQLILDEAEHGYIDADVATALGHVYLHMQQYGRAINCYAHAVQENPSKPDIYVNLATAHANAGHLLEAEGSLRKALELDPEFPKALADLGAVLLNKHDYSQAEELLKRAQSLRPTDTDVLANMAAVSFVKGDFDTAIELAMKVLKKNRKYSSMYLLLASIDIALGHADDAIHQYGKAIATNKYYGEAYTGLACAKKFTNDDIPAIKRYEKFLEDGMPPDCRSHIHFAIGKMKDDIGEYDEAFKHYRQANLLANRSFDKNIGVRLFRQFKRIFTSAQLSKSHQLGHDSDVPIFIVGMPRSGTSLIEQIIASHPDVFGAGELIEIDRIKKKLCESSGSGMVKESCEESLIANVLRKSAEEYLSVLRRNSGTAKRVIDKAPENFLFLGLIYMLFPNSKIIHVIRNPLDTCLSCYFQDFKQVSWSFDLDNIADRYNLYREMMSYWKSVLPEGSLLDVHYENLIESPESESRRMIEFLELPWDDACLEFYKAERAVRTASQWQVRQPIYRTSKMRARHYAKHLSALANKLQRYLPDDPAFRREFGIRKKVLGIF